MQIHRSSADSDSEPTSSRSLRDDTRAVTPLIGFILLFGIGVVAFASYQATTVPDQNAQTEFTHSQDVRDDMVDVRSGILQAGEGERQFKSVKLGTQYRDRILAVNPSPARGILSTTSPEAVQLSSNTLRSSIETRFLLYEPRYNQLPNDPTYYDTTAVYLDPLGNDNTVRYEDQSIIDDDEVRLIALQNQYITQGVQRSSVELYPGSSESLNVTERLLDDRNEFEFTVEIPTRLDEEDWGEMIDGQFDEDDAWRVDETTDPNTLELDFNESRTLHLSTVGVGGSPGLPEGILSAILADGSASNLDAAISGGQNQWFNFTVGQDGLEGGEEVEIDLDEPVESDEITYPADGTEPEVVEGEGNAIYIKGANDASIFYTAPEEGLAEGEDVAIDLPGVDAEGATSGEEYTVDFIDPRDGLVQAIFEIIDSDAPPEASLSNLDIAEQGSSATISEGENEDIAVDITNIGGDGEFDLALEIDGTVEEEIEGIELDAGEEQTEVFEGVTGDKPAGEYDVTVRAFFDGDEQDSISGELVVEEPPDPEINMRIDDLTDIRGNAPEFYVSYDIEGEHDEVDITINSQESAASDSARTDPSRGGELLNDVGFGSGEQFNITVTALEEEDPVVSQTITTIADTQNPGENADLSYSGSATLDEISIIDDSNIQPNNVRYKYDYAISPNDGFSEAYALVLNTGGNGGSDYRTTTEESQDGFQVPAGQPLDGVNTEYKVGMMILDDTGAVVDDELQTDIADGTDP